MKNTINYIQEVFGIKIDIAEIPKAQVNGLPFYLTNKYTFWKGTLMDRKIVFAKKFTDEHYTPDQYKKQLDLLHRHFNHPVVFILPDLEAYKRNRLIRKRINFTIANKQLFIPGLFIDIREYALKTQKKEDLKPVAQCLILYHLQKRQLNGYTYKQLAEELKYPYLDITRAVENIQALNLCTVDGAKEKTIRFEFTNTELWKKAHPFMKNPAIRKVFTDSEIDTGIVYRSNINALAYYTNLNDEEQTYLAVHQNTFRKLNKEGRIKGLRDHEGKYCIEIWRYKPAVLANNEFVDPLSVFLEFKDHTDERVQLALKDIIQQQKW